MGAEPTETPRTTDLRKWLGQKKISTSNTSTIRDSEKSNDVQQDAVTEDYETVAQGTMGEDRQKIMCTVKLSFTAGESAITSFLSALSRQQQKASRLDNMDSMLTQILGTLK